MNKVVVVGPFPPPVHGFSLMTERLAQFLENGGCELRQINVGSDAAILPLRHIHQSLFYIWAALVFPVCRAAGFRTLSLGVNGGTGGLYTLMCVCIARMCFYHILLHHHSFAYINSKTKVMQAILTVGGSSLEHVFLSHSMKSDFESAYKVSTLAHVVQNALFVPTNDRSARSVNRRVSVGLLSNLSAEKGLYDFLKLANDLTAETDAFEFILAGPARGSDEAAIKESVAAGLVDWIGPVYGEHKVKFFADIDVFVFPTNYVNEAQPTVIYEAFACGVPVIAKNRGAIKEQVANNLCAVSADDDFNKVASEALLKCCEQSFRRKKSESAFQKFEVDRLSAMQALKIAYKVSD